MRRIGIYIHEHKDWPNFKWDPESLHLLLGEVRSTQGRLIGKMETLGFPLREEAALKLWLNIKDGTNGYQMQQ